MGVLLQTPRQRTLFFDLHNASGKGKKVTWTEIFINVLPTVTTTGS